MLKAITRGGILPVPRLTLVIAFMMIGLFYVLGPAAEGLVYQQDKILQGEIWRLITGHFIHCDFNHLLWNLTAFCIVGSLIEYKNPTVLIYTLLAAIMGVNIWLLFDSNIVLYCGLSGVLNSLFVVALFLAWHDTKHPLIPLIVLGYCIKLSYETITSNALLTDISWQTVPLAHVSGMVVGLMCVRVLVVRKTFE